MYRKDSKKYQGLVELFMAMIVEIEQGAELLKNLVDYHVRDCNDFEMLDDAVDDAMDRLGVAYYNTTKDWWKICLECDGVVLFGSSGGSSWDGLEFDIDDERVWRQLTKYFEPEPFFMMLALLLLDDFDLYDARGPKFETEEDWQKISDKKRGEYIGIKYMRFLKKRYGLSEYTRLLENSKREIEDYYYDQQHYGPI